MKKVLDVAILLAALGFVMFVGIKSVKGDELHEHPTIVAMRAENNAMRAVKGLPAQTLSPELTKASQDHANYMARTGRLTHYSNGGPAGRCKRYGYKGSAAENIAMGQKSIREVFRDWKRSRGHYRNMMGRAKVVGFGCARSARGSLFFVAMYGF